MNTVYVESRNGKFRKDDTRLIRYYASGLFEQKYYHRTPAMSEKIITHVPFLLKRTAEPQFGGLKTAAKLGFGGTFQPKSASREHERK